MSSAFPTPDDPLAKRAMAAVLMLMTMPLWWPLVATTTAMLVFIWILMGFIIALLCVIMFAWPLMAFKGVEPDTTTKYEVEVDNNKVSEFKKAATAVGATVEKK